MNELVIAVVLGFKSPPSDTVKSVVDVVYAVAKIPVTNTVTGEVADKVQVGEPPEIEVEQLVIEEPVI